MVVAYQARADDDDFRADWDRTKGLVDEIRADAIERATADRAVNGSKYQKYTPKGDLIEEGVVPDTPAAVTMLKAYRPARFKERPTEVEGAEVLNSFTALVRAFGDAARARPALQASAPPQLPPESAAPAIEATATVQEAAPPASLIRQVN